MKEIIITNKREIIVEAETAKEALEQITLDYLEKVISVKPLGDNII